MSLRKLAFARQMYVCGFALPHIAEVLNIPVEVLARKAQQYAFEASRSAYQFRSSAIKRTMMDSFLALRAGKRPKIAPAQALAYAQAYEKVSNSGMEAHHLYHAYERLTDALVARAEKAKTQRSQHSALRLLKGLRLLMEEVLLDTLKRTQHETQY